MMYVCSTFEHWLCLGSCWNGARLVYFFLVSQQCDLTMDRIYLALAHRFLSWVIVWVSDWCSWMCFCCLKWLNRFYTWIWWTWSILWVCINCGCISFNRNYTGCYVYVLFDRCIFFVSNKTLAVVLFDFEFILARCHCFRICTGGRYIEYWWTILKDRM